METDFLGIPERSLNRDLVTDIARGVGGHSDIEVAVPLARLMHNEFEAYGTRGDAVLSNEGARSALFALRAVLGRLGVEFKPPFSDFERFRSYWLKNGAHGSWQARRDILEELFEPVHDRLAELHLAAYQSDLATPAGDKVRSGWPGVDEELGELRRHFQAATTPQDYRNIGNDCVIVLERLSEAAYVPERHLPEGQEEPPVSSTKLRFEQIIEAELQGPSKSELRKLARAAIENAQAVKHRTPDRQSAGIAADSVVLVVSMFRRLLDADH